MAVRGPRWWIWKHQAGAQQMPPAVNIYLYLSIYRCTYTMAGLGLARLGQPDMCISIYMYIDVHM